MPTIIKIIIFLIVGYLLKLLFTNKGSKSKDYAEELVEITAYFLLLKKALNLKFYFSNHKKSEFLKRFQTTYNAVNDNSGYKHLIESDIKLINDFKNSFQSLSDIAESYNPKFIRSEKTKFKDLFDNLEQHPLSDDQRTAIITDEDNNLVIAGAGTGKTTTIAGKVAYIIKKKLAKPNEILVISYTNAAVKEMGSRIRTYLDDDTVTEQIKIKTFNSYGYEVNRSVRKSENLSVAFDDEDSEKVQLQKIFDSLFLNSSDFTKKATNFLAFFNRPPRDEFAFETGNDFYKHEKSFKNVGINGEKYKSKEEVEIANFLYLNSINFKYEDFYPLKLEDKNPIYGDYRPDFYLTDYNIYIEHYALDKDGNVPKWFNDTAQMTAKERYHNGIMWKDEIHTRYETTLVKTYSFENTQGVLIKNLKKKLLAHAVVLKPKNPQDILDSFKEQESYSDFIKLIGTFLSLMKSNGKKPDDIPYKDDLRLKVFIDVFKPMYITYEAHLNKNSLLDFNDMINHAAIGIEQNKHQHGFKYILIDEFQDMSLSRYKLMRAFQMQKPDVKIYAVGDDWQSVFRFSGSDISLMTEFKKYFGYTKYTNILNTYRFNSEILETTSGFIQKNTAQLRKELTALTEPSESSFEFIAFDLVITDKTERQIYYHEKIGEVLDKLILLKRKLNVFVIGRYKHDNPNLPEELENLHIKFYTAHSAKGLTCDYAIVMNVNSGIFGFPSEIVDDPILEYLLYEGDHFENAEERRLFYVATTRARYKNFIFYDAYKESKFISELKKDLNYLEEGLPPVICRICSGVMIKRRGRYGDFYGCSNYPNCSCIVKC